MLQSFQGKLFEELVKMDPSGEGIVAIEDVLNALKRRNISDVEPSELTVLVHSCDRGNHGVLILDNFEKRLYDLAQETEKEKLMRRFSRDSSTQQTSLANLLSVKDVNHTGKLDFMQFKKAFASSTIPLSEQDLKSLFEEGQPADSNEGFFIKVFCDKVAAVYRSKPIIWDFRAPKAGTAKV